MFDPVIQDKVEKHRSAGVLVDANLLLVYQVGLYDPTLVERFKRTRSFARRDFHLLRQFLQLFKRVLTTPGILAEVNSLASQLEGSSKDGFLAAFGKQIEILDERYRPSREACQHAYYVKCGLTDAAIMTIAQTGLLVLTDDYRLAGVLAKLGIDAINFNHLRMYLLDR